MEFFEPWSDRLQSWERWKVVTGLVHAWETVVLVEVVIRPEELLFESADFRDGLLTGNRVNFVSFY